MENKKVMYCPTCGKKITDAYQSRARVYKHLGHIPFCKDCIWKTYENNLDFYKDEKQAVYITCAMYNIPFSEAMFEGAKKNYGKSKGKAKVFKTYMTKMNSFGRKNGETSEFDYGNIYYTPDIVDEKNDDDYLKNKTNEKLKYNKKWCGYYTSSELEYLEEYVKELNLDFKIKTRNHKDYAMKIAKASLYMDKCFEELNNGSGSDKKYKEAKEIFDTLSQSAKFAEKTRTNNEVGLGCFGKVFEQVESEIYVPKHTVIDPDQIDAMAKNMKHILKSV